MARHFSNNLKIQSNAPNMEQWTKIVEEIYIMEKITHRLRLQEAQHEEKWLKWTTYKTKTENSD